MPHFLFGCAFRVFDYLHKSQIQSALFSIPCDSCGILSIYAIASRSPQSACYVLDNCNELPLLRISWYNLPIV